MSIQLETPRVTREQALEIAERAAEILKTRFGATRVIVFGSARGDAPWHGGSDLDLAVEGLPGENFWKARRALWELMPPELSFDLIELEATSLAMRQRIMERVDLSQDSVKILKSLIEDELAALEIIARENNEMLATVAEPPLLKEIRAMGSILNDFYSGVELIFERIAVQVDEELPHGQHWHADLLAQMNSKVPSLRPRVIDDQLWTPLKDDLDFRHVFQHAYGSRLKWEKMFPNVERMSKTLAMLRAQLDAFFTALEQMKHDEK